MTYNYDRRTAAKKTPEDLLEGFVSKVVDYQEALAFILDDKDEGLPSLSEHSEGVKETAQAIADELDVAQSCDVLADLFANLREARKAYTKVEPEIKKALAEVARALKDETDKEAIEALKTEIDNLRDLSKELGKFDKRLEKLIEKEPA